MKGLNMAKSKIDQLLDKKFPTNEDLQFIFDYYSKKPFEELTEEEANYLNIAKNLLEAGKNKESKEEPIVNKKEKALEIIAKEVSEFGFCEVDLVIKCKDYQDYINFNIDNESKEHYSQEEFDLLKEVLCK